MAASTALFKKLDDLAEQEQFDQVIKLVCAEIAKAKNGKSIQALEGAEAVEEIFSGESDAGAEVGAALLARAFKVGGASGADILRVLNVVSWYDLTEPLYAVPPKYPHRKNLVLSAVEANKGQIIQGITDKNASFRAASLYLLLSCSTLDAADAGAVLQLLAKEKDSSVRLTAVLALGVIGHALSAKDTMRLECVKAVEAEAKKYPTKFATLAVACVANAYAMLGVAWTAKFAKEVNATFKKPAPLPAAWGYHEKANTTWIVTPAISVQPATILEPLIEGIAKIGSDAEEILYQLAFGDAKETICGGLGIVLDELNPLQRRVLTAFAGREFKDSYSFREQFSIFSMDLIKDPIEGKVPLWKPLKVKTKKGDRELAPAIIWRMTARDMIEMSEAIKTLTSLPVKDLGEIALYGSDAIYPFNGVRAPEDRKRNMEVLANVLAFLEEKDKEWPKRVRAAHASKKRKVDTSIGFALTRLVRQGKLKFEEGDKDMVQMFVLSAMGGSPSLINEVPTVPQDIRDYIIQDAVPSSLKEIKQFLANHPYKG